MSETQPTHVDITSYFYTRITSFITFCVCILILMARFGWLSVVGSYQGVYLQILNDYIAVARIGNGSKNQVNNTSQMASVNPTDRPKSVRNRCVI